MSSDIPESKIRDDGSGELYGVSFRKHPVSVDTPTHIRQLRALELDERDILVAAYPKCGTHWVWEVTQMLMNQSTEFSSRCKEFVMMEFADVDKLMEEPSPRILNSHMHFPHLPQCIVEKKIKIIHVVRNPKDAIVSMYFHIRQTREDPPTLQQIINSFVKTRQLAATPDQLSYLQQMSAFQKQHPDHPVKLIYFEEMKKNPVQVTQELAEFLQVPASEEFCRQVAQACDFQKMKSQGDNRELPEGLRKHMPHLKKKLELYRKGEVGDWKNHLTVAQSEMLDAFIAEHSKGLDLTFIYE